MANPAPTSRRDAGSSPEHPGWDARHRGPLESGCAIAVRPSQERVEQAKAGCVDLLPDEPDVRPAQWTPAWRGALEGGVAYVLAAQQLPGAWFPTLNVPRPIHGQSQGICDLFGAPVERQNDGNYFVHPLRPDAATIDAIEPRAIETSMYWSAVEWINYARAASRGEFAFRNPVMTGPFDTANYLLGTTVLMEWVRAEPAALHRLLDKITDVIVGMLRALRRAAGGNLHGDMLSCMRNVICLCSECRALVSAEMYEEFEAPCLARIGKELGPYGIHSCGSWERTVPSALEDPNLRAMHGQVRENNLAALCQAARGEVLFSIGPSVNLDERYTWADTESFLRYVIENAPSEQPLEVSIDESDLDLWNTLWTSIRGGAEPDTPAIGKRELP